MIPPTFLLGRFDGWQRPPRLGTAEGAFAFLQQPLEIRPELCFISSIQQGGGSMLLIDKKLFKQGASMIEPFDEEQVTNIGYDLRTDCFFLDTNTSKKEVDLAPGDTVFVRTTETLDLPNDMAAAQQPHPAGAEPDRADLSAGTQIKGVFPGNECHETGDPSGQ
jgi:hypothetical protein